MVNPDDSSDENIKQKPSSIKITAFGNINGVNGHKHSYLLDKGTNVEQSHKPVLVENNRANDQDSTVVSTGSQHNDDSDSDIEISVGSTNSSTILESLKSEQEKLEFMLQKAEKQLKLELQKQKNLLPQKTEADINFKYEINSKTTTSEKTDNEPDINYSHVLHSKSGSDQIPKKDLEVNFACKSKEQTLDDEAPANGNLESNNGPVVNQQKINTSTEVQAQIPLAKPEKEENFTSQPETICDISESERENELLKIANISKIPKLRFDKVTVPKKTRVRHMYEICSSFNIMPLLTVTYDINDWLNQLHLFLSLMGFPHFVRNTLEIMNKEATFTPLQSEETEYLITLLLRKSILVEELRMQSSLLTASEQLANIITYITENKDNQLNCSLYLWPGISCSGSVSGGWSLNALMERYLSLWKFDEPHMLEFKSEFYEWYVGLEYFLSQLGMSSLLKPIVHMRNHRVPLQPLIDPSAEFILRNYCLRTVHVAKLDSEWCGEKMIYKAIYDCGFMESTLQVRSKISTLMIKNDDFNRLREDYYSAMMHARFLGLTFEPQKIFGIILKRSAKKYQHYSRSFLESHPDLSLDEFIDYLESINDLAVETGAQFEPMPPRAPRKRGIKRKVSFKGNPSKKIK